MASVLIIIVIKDLCCDCSNDSFYLSRTISDLFPTFMRVPASGQATAITELFNGSYVDCGIKLRVGSVPNVTGEVEWWELTQKTPQPIFDSPQSTSDLEIITFNDYVPPLHLSFFASTG